MFRQEKGYNLQLKHCIICPSGVTSLRQELNISLWSSPVWLADAPSPRSSLWQGWRRPSFLSVLPWGWRNRHPWHYIPFYMLSSSALGASCPSLTRCFPPCVVVPLWMMRGCQEVTEQAGSSWQLCCLIHNRKVIRSWWSECCHINTNSDREQTIHDINRLLIYKVPNLSRLLCEKAWV